ncbi:MAG: hypothetical protein ACSLE0_08110 [Chitinophagaceae bacterium]
MAHYKFTKETIEILKACKVSTSTSNNTSIITISYPQLNKILSGEKKGQSTKGWGAININIVNSPTGNCQLASLSGFYYIVKQFHETSYITNEDIEREKYNVKSRRLAILKGFGAIRHKITSKKQFFIDIPASYIDKYHEMHDWFCVKRIQKREVKYTSTNGSSMMYSIIQIRPITLQRYYEVN